MAGGFSEDGTSKHPSFRVGKVQAYLRGRVWYLCYHEAARRRPRVGPDRSAARQLAAQLQAGAPAALSFEPVSVPDLRQRWLDHHEQVLRSSVSTISRYRTATDYLLRFLQRRPVRHASQFHAAHAVEFLRHLRTLRVSPNGHANTAKRLLMDKDLRYVLECCLALFSFAARHRHLPPYAENPIRTLEVDRIPVRESRPVELFTPVQERVLFAACDDWQFPFFITLALTSLRPGELCHLLLPEDVDLTAGVLHVRNKPRLGWQVKTREREVPLVPALAEVLRAHLGGRAAGPAFVWRTFSVGPRPADVSAAGLERELERRALAREAAAGEPVDRAGRLGGADRRKLDEYLTGLREVERRVESARPAAEVGQARVPVPAGVPQDFAEHARLLGDLVALAFRADLTRVATFALGNDGSNRGYREAGVPEGHHDLSHHGGDPDKQAKLARVNRLHVAALAHFLGRLKGAREGGGALLDSCLVVYGSGIRDGDRHDHDDLPVLLAGGGGGTVKPGRHVRYPRGTPLTNLYLALLDRAGVRAGSFGDSTGRLAGLDA